MKRQHSEDAGQMHNITARDHTINGTAPAKNSLSLTAASGQPTHLSRQAHILQDGHFRRAGSQPPPSSHLAAIGLGRVCGHSLVSGDNSAGLSTYGLLQTTTTGTNGSSSGVSSTTSSTIAANSLASSEGPVDQLANSSLSQQQQQQQQQNQRQTLNNVSRGSWASRMKRGAVATGEPVPTGNPASVSRYRFRRDDSDQRQVASATESSSATQNGAEITGRQSAPNVSRQPQQIIIGDDKRQLRAHYEPATQPLELRRQRAQRMMNRKLSLLHLRGARGSLRRNSISDEDWAAEEEADEEEEEQQQQKRLADSGQAEEEDEDEDEEDSDLNDIYSTPNDSIQSVPSGGRLPETTTSSQTTQVVVVNKRTPALPSYHMTKSFSTDSFNSGRLAHQKQQQQQQYQGQSNIKRIDENETLSSATRLTPGVRADFNGEQHEHQQQVTTASSTQRKSNTSASSSRFFISSSSSEDSNTVQQRHSSSTSTVRNNNQPATERVPLNVGLHYHAPPARRPLTRPDSLLIPATQLPFSTQQASLNLATPSALIMNPLDGTPSASVAAMSPMFLHPIHGVSLMRVQNQPGCQLLRPTNYKKSPSLFEMSSASSESPNLVARFSSKYPSAGQRSVMLPPDAQLQMCSSFIGNSSRQVAAGAGAQQTTIETSTGPRIGGVPQSISLHDCKLTSADTSGRARDCLLPEVQNQRHYRSSTPETRQDCKVSEYKLAQMLLELGRSHNSTSGAHIALKDQLGYTALMHAILSENLSAIKCLIEHGVDLNEINNEGESALDLVCSKQVAVTSDTSMPIEMMKLLIEHQVDLDKPRASDGSRLLDRLIGQHDSSCQASDKLAFIECLLHNGAKLGSATWAAASGKPAIQMRLLRKLCQDGYFLYKKSSIEAAVYRFEYALKRIVALEQQLDDRERRLRKQRIGPSLTNHHLALQGGVSAGQADDSALDLAQARAAVQQVKYQTFLGLSRCERKRRFFKRALEFAHMSILVDSTSYEGYYSKAHILKDLGEVDDALLAIDQTERLVTRSIEMAKIKLCELKHQQESIVLDGCFHVHDPQRARWIESSRADLNNTLDYLLEAKKHIARLRTEILDDKKTLARQMMQEV